MSSRKTNLNRRTFLRSIGAAGVGSAFAYGAEDANDAKAVSEEKKIETPQVPKRVLGKTGEEVPVLSLGMMFKTGDKLMMLKRAFDWGVRYWDTAYMYMNGNSEKGIGKYFKRFKGSREQVFIVSKASGASTPEDVEKRFQESCKRLNTDYIDLYYGVHGCSNPEEELNEGLKQWALKAKAEGKIRYFGFSTHSNMQKCLKHAAKLDWIDAIMTSYNFRLMQDKEMQDAVQACYDSGIGLVAMKVMSHSVESEADKKLAQHFIDRGFTEGQAKLKAVLEDKRITAACVGRENLEHMMLNIAATLDKTKLSRADYNFLHDYASQTCSGYCAGCREICENALTDDVPVADVMRYLMYYNSYTNEQEHARELFAQLPQTVRGKLQNVDYSAAERSCPQKLPIAKLISEAARKLS